MWTDTEDKLITFLNNLNGAHPKLTFTYNYSYTSVDFLDLTIYKSTNFHFTNLLDTKTYKKPLNLYQYLHFSSTHPPNIFKAIIKGECVRYARTNTTYETFTTTVHTFRRRLHKRNYPDELINKTISTVTYHNRQKYMKRTRPPRTA